MATDAAASPSPTPLDAQSRGRGTARPWHVEVPKKIDGKHYAAGDTIKIWPALKKPGGWTVASVAVQSPNCKANAHLIVRAVNSYDAMLAALEAVQLWAEKQSAVAIDGYPKDDVDNAVLLATQAEGRQP